MEERDDYPIIPQGEEAPKKEEVKDVYVLIDELHADADYLLSRAIQKPEDKAMLVEAVRRKLDLIKELAVPETTVIDGIKIIKLMCELASMKEENALLKECFELSEQAKNHLRTKGYGWTGLDILKTCELVPFSDNK